MLKRKVILPLLMLCLLLLAACGGQAVEEAQEAVEEAAEQVEEAVEEAVEEVSVDDAEPFAGETIEIIIPYGEGGGSDTWTRALAPFLQTYLGDDVTVQPINMPGASGTLGANDFAAREADGLSLLVSSGSNALPYILGEEAVQYDFADFAGVMGSPVGGVVYVSADTGITSVADLCDAGDLIYGGISPTGLDLVPLMAFDLMGLDYLPILGYDGRGAARVAFEQGEINLDYQTSPAFLKNVQPLVEEGSAVPLFAFGILDSNGDIAADPVFSDLPNVVDAIEACGGPTSGAEFEGFKAAFTAGFAAQKNLWVAGDAPQARIDALTEAAQATIADPEFQAIAADLLGGYEFYAGADEVSTAFGAANNMSADAFNALKGFLDRVFDVAITKEPEPEEEAMAMAEVTGAFAGETIEIVIPYGEGGGSDTWTRALAPFLQKYLGDDVTVQPINMPGASGTLGANDFAARTPDGLSLLVSSGSNALPYLLGQDAVMYDFADFSGVMGSPVGGVVYVSADTGITTVEELCASGGELIYGGISATGLDMVPLLAFDLMGLDFLPILGYDGRGAARVAFEQGEINLDYQTSPAFIKNVQPLVDEGEAVPLFAFGILDESGNIADDPVFSDLPNVEEAIAACGGPTSGADFEGFKAAFTAGFAAQKNLWVHGDAPADKIADLTAAAQMALKDEEFQAIATDLLGGYEFYAGADAVGTAFGAASSMSDDAFNSLKDFLNNNYEAGIGADSAASVVAEPEVTGAYSGETIEIIIPYGEGGGSDTWTRAFAPFLQKYLGDDVTIQPINMSGASGTLGANEFAQNRDSDGLTLLNSSGSNALPYLLGQDAVQYDFATFAGIAGSPVGGVVYVSADTGITSVEDLCSSGEELIFGGISATGLDMVPLLAFDLMGVEFFPILGYDGRGAARVAFEQGEINLDYQTSSAYIKNVQPLVDEGLAVPLFAFGILDEAGNIADDPVFNDLPNAQEAIEACGGDTSSLLFEAFKGAFTAGFAAQKNLWVHGDAPADKIADLTAAAQLAIADPEFAEIATDLLGGYEFYAGADAVGTAFGAASEMSPEALDTLKGFLNDNYEAGLE